MNRRIFLTAAGMTAIGGWPMRAWSEEAYPSRPIRLVQPYAAGGPTDTTSRIIAARLSQVLGQSVVVEARPGAGGTLAAEMITRAPPDGYTLLYTSAGLASAAALYKNLRFDPRKDLTAVGRTISISSILLGSMALPVTDAAQLIAYMKANPGKLSYGSGGVGNGSHLQIEALLSATGTSAVHVPYQGTAQAQLGLIRGDVHFAMDALGSALAVVKDRRLRALAIGNDTRDPALPDLSTLAEQGLPSGNSDGWNGIFAPPGTPAPIVRRLNDALRVALSDEGVKAALGRQAARITPSTPEELTAQMANDIDKNARIIRAANIPMN
jgi:tripartite-type tricarboxylate transporter receptor subunit TctC